MSHHATFWLTKIPPDDLVGSEFRVLFFLCDHHNSDKDPTLACFPSQEQLRAETGLSNGGLNNALASLESKGIIRRRAGTVPNTSKRRTYFILGCDEFPTTTQTPKNGVCANSNGVELGSEQTPLSGRANSTFGQGKLQIGGVSYEPVKKPVKESSSLLANANDDDEVQNLIKDGFDQVFAIYPRSPDHKRNDAFQIFTEIVGGKRERIDAIIAKAKKYEADTAGYSETFLHIELQKWLKENADHFDNVPAKPKPMSEAELKIRTAMGWLKIIKDHGIGTYMGQVEIAILLAKGEITKDDIRRGSFIAENGFDELVAKWREYFKSQEAAE